METVLLISAEITLSCTVASSKLVPILDKSSSFVLRDFAVASILATGFSGHHLSG